jgi:predicted Zn-dependent protease
MAPGTTDPRDMILGVERGLWVTRFHYVNVVQPLQAVLTGMTRDGTFLIRHGEIAEPVRNLRFTQNMLDALASVRRVSSSRRAVEGFWGASLVPAILTDRFRFTGVSEAAA